MNDTSTSISVMDSNILTQFNIQTENSTAHSQDLINATITPHELTNTEENKGLTKDGRPRKRQKFNESVKERQEKKKKVRDEQNDLKDPCTEKCMKKCVTKFTPQVRQDIHDRYIAFDYESQGLFIKCCIDVKPVMRRSQVTEDYKRKTTYIYNLKGPDNIKKEVCKTFFLSTLGYKPNNDRRITTAMSKAIDEQKTTRGSYKRTIIDRQAIKDHIMSYHPAISHYRREHAPKKLYLPSDITITMMHENFCSTRPDIKVSLEVYRKVVRNDLNISFAHLGNEECEQCEYFKRHNRLDHQEESCEICQNYNMQHKPRYIESRKEYNEDREKAKTDTEVIYYSVDLQKIIMLPRMDQFKTAIFCPRLIAFNESFVPLGPATKDNKPYAVLWNESVAGRSQEDIISLSRHF
ncbi:unnamed protein product [Arctia plantaginis]|uniref:Uncharacterized protein n=1 Tax=Arctia plantaginis TaxID=874455 RepID=A0A8S0ZFD5_ARCPL|nr:unnamed protein product [Arctia plantaginis]